MATPTVSPAPTPAPTSAPVQWTQEQLFAHLQMAINVEFFTIPLYLTAAASIRPKARSSLSVKVSGEDAQGNPIHQTVPVYNAVVSVAVEEMYHLMWICNVAKSVGMSINITAPDMTKLPPQLSLPPGIAAAYTGPANLADVIDLLIAIETPDPKYNYPANPNDPITKFAGPIAPQASYNSIGDLYHALAYGLNELFSGLHQSAYDSYQKTMISGRYPDVLTVTDLNSALNCIAAIVEQGEGTGVEGFIPGGYDPLDDGPFTTDDQFTHYERFVAIKSKIATIKPDLYSAPASGEPTNANQQILTSTYSTLLQSINASYTTAGGNLNLPNMASISGTLDALWGASLLPLWTYATPAPTPAPLELHVCQGLNSCAGKGANGSGTMPGDGDCATVNNSCAGSNNCSGQGGCGFAPQNGAPAWIPGQNACKGAGGCASPISVWQVFASGPLEGQYVWCQARKLFEESMEKLNKTTGAPAVQPAAARQAQSGSTNPGPSPLANNNSCPTS